jgi:hypothetical protein
LTDLNVNLQTISYLIAALSFAVTCAYYIMNLNNNKKNQELTLKAQQQNLETRQAQLFMQIYSNFYSDPIQKARNEVAKWSYRDFDDFQSKYSYDVNPVASQLNSSLSFFFEGIGVLVLRGLVDPSLVDDLMSGPIISYWEKMRPYYLEYRVRHDWPQFGEYTEYLYGRIKPIAERQKGELRKLASV